MKLALIVLLLVSICSLSTFAKVTIKPDASKRKPSSENSQAAGDVFVSFLRCDVTSADAAEECARVFFAKSVTKEMLRRYLEALTFPNKYSMPYECDEEKTKLVKVLEEQKYDLFLCFESNINSPETRTGIVFFKLENKDPKIVKLKM